MSLIIWLPMDGNLTNNGTLTLPSPSANTITYTDGKTCNKCGTGQLIYHFTDDPIPSSSDYSIAMWVSVLSDFPSGNIILYSKNTSEYTNCQSYFSIHDTGTQLRFFTHNGQEILANYTFSKNTWYHVACTRNGNTIHMYVNGSLIKTQTCTITSISSLNMCIGCRSGNASGTNVVGSASMKYNDIRIYDECISDDEVYRLSRGLVLHYPMTGGFTDISQVSSYSDNLEYDVSGHNYNGSTTDITYVADSSTYNISSSFNGTSSKITAISPTNMVRSVAFWLYAPKTNSTVAFVDYKSQLGFGFGSSGPIVVSCVTDYPYVYPNTAISANTWCHIALIRNGDRSSITLYINGVIQSASSVTTCWTHETDTLMIGCRSASNPRYMSCKIADFRMYSMQLTQDDITKLYNFTKNF